MKNTPLVQKWLKNLESGNYNKTTCTLRNEKGYCCLGVFCDTLDPSGWSEPNINREYYYNRPNVCSSLLSDLNAPLRELIGMTPEEMGELIKMNDSGRTFKEIASHIRKEMLEE